MASSFQDPTTHPLIGQRIGSYRVERELARGGMGVVFEAVHESIGHRLAVKVLGDGLVDDPRHSDYVARFYDEARAVNLIRHPGVLKISDFGELPGGGVYIMMELLSGESLWDRIWRLRQETGQRMTQRAALRTVRLIASAMAAAHRERILHRDLKPENIFLVEDPDMEGGERVKVLDFGIARFLDSPYRRTTLGIVLGTPIYMSPEQCEGADDLSEKVDVYSLGIMAYELLAGAPPFSGETAHLLRQHASALPPALSGPCPGLPEAVYRLTAEMLHKKPAARPTMAQVAARLSQIDGTISDAPAGTERPRAAQPPAQETMLVGIERGAALRPRGVLLGATVGAALVVLAALLWMSLR